MGPSDGNSELYLVDAYALIFQVFHAVGEMSSPRGLPTNALFGFTRDLLFLHEELRPDYLIVVFDEGQPDFRLELHADYKANRGEMPEQLRMQLGPIREMIEAMNVPAVGKAGFEADDLIATLACAGAARGLDVYICSSDKDCRQLIGDRVRIYNLRKKSILDRAELLKDWGVTPEQVVDLQSLVGDAVDNVDGVPGIGLKTAAKLLQEYQTLDNLLAHVDEVSGTKRRENLKAATSVLERNRKLVRLDCNVPMDFDWAGWRRRPVNAARLLELFRGWGFHRFADQVQSAAGLTQVSQPSRQKVAPAVTPGTLFTSLEEEPGANGTLASDVHADGGAPSRTSVGAGWEADYHLVDTPEKLEDFLERASRHHRMAVDLETTALEPWNAEIVGYAICLEPKQSYYLAVRGPQGSRLLHPEMVRERLRLILEDPKVEKINQNIKYDVLVLRQQGIELRGIAGDSMVADYLLNAGERNHNLQSLARTYLQHEVIPITDLIGKKGAKQKRMDEVDPARIAVYAGEDADVAWRLCELLEMKLDEQHLRELYDTLEIPLIEVLAELEHNGIRLDVPRLRKLGAQLGEQLQGIEKRIYEIAGEEFNINSLKQLRTVLFERLNLPVRRKTGITGEASTDQETLEWLAGQGHELPQLLLKHRQLSKLKGTYIDTLPELVNPRNGRIHASFHQTVAATGRLSSSEPNLQNIPIRTELGGQIRQAFVPEEGWVLLTADYSQIELRLLAHFSEDPVLQQAFHEDRDIHALVAAQIYGVPEDQVTAEMRRRAKTVNFGVIYGMSAYGLAQRLQITREEAASFIDAYFARYPRVLRYQDQLLQRCREQGFVSTLLGRRRPFQSDVIRPDSTYQQRSQAEREAINMEIQGTAADLIKVAMLNVLRRLRREQRRSRLLLQIHDELVFEAPPEEVNPVARLVVEEMTGALAGKLRVPLKVDVSAGPNWLDVAEMGSLE
jgi:DNA polymerase-1